MVDLENRGTPVDKKLPVIQRLCYGVGHVLNDLCASMWFSYLLVFLHKVLGFSNVLAGYMMLLGQVADALFTPVIGYESDSTTGWRDYGQRKTWHLLGSVCVMASFPFVFMTCAGCEAAEDWAMLIYYAPFVVIFQFGWASTQISHLALIPELAPKESERVELNAIRYAFTVVSSIYVYGMAWWLLGEAGDGLSQEDFTVFRNLALIVVATGAVFVLIFHKGTKERRKNKCDGLQSPNRSSDSSIGLHITVIDWLKEPQFYQVALVYMCTRLVVNLSQIYMPMYLTDSLALPKDYIAIVPLIVYVSGFVMSLVMKPVNKCVGRKITYVLGCLLVMCACIWMFFLTRNLRAQVICASVLLGAGNSTILVTSLSILADLIGTNTSSGAFVYGAMSFTDKLSNGVAVVLIQNLQPCSDVSVLCGDSVWYYRNMMSFVPSVVAVVAVIGVISLAPSTIGQLRVLKGLNHSSADSSASQCKDPSRDKVTSPLDPVKRMHAYGTVDKAR